MKHPESIHPHPTDSSLSNLRISYLVLMLPLLFALAVGCGGGGDDNDDGSEASTTEGSGDETASSSEGEADNRSDSRRPGLAKITVCSEAGGPVTVSVNGDTLENNRVEPGGTLFINTVAGRVTYNATAAGVLFMPVTLDMRTDGREQSVNLICMTNSDGGDSQASSNNDSRNSSSDNAQAEEPAPGGFGVIVGPTEPEIAPGGGGIAEDPPINPGIGNATVNP